MIANGEKKTDELQAKLKTDAQHNLASFTLSGDIEDSTIDTFAFDGENYRDKRKGDLFIDMGTRERKRAKYDVNEYYKEVMNAGETSGMKAHAADAKAKKKKKGPKAKAGARSLCSLSRILTLALGLSLGASGPTGCL